MSIGQNIAKYRKEIGFTQEELGARLGVSNQAISKWECEIAMPDIMLLPHIADALGVSLDVLYGRQEREAARSCADDFPLKMQDVMTRAFFDHCRCRFTYVERGEEAQYSNYIRQLKNGELLACISDRVGCVEIGEDLAFVDPTFKTPEGAEVLNSIQIAHSLSVLAEEHCRKLLRYQYRASMEDKDPANRFFTVEELCAHCDLSEKEAVLALEKLTAIGLQERGTDPGGCGYYLIKSQMRYVLAVYKLANRLLSVQAYLVLRDTSIISDYAFEAL